MTKPLQARPDLGQLKRQAKDLHHQLKSHEPGAVTRLREVHPLFRGATEEQLQRATFRLSDAQVVLAREFGFPSWTALREGVFAVRLAGSDPVALLTEAFHADDAGMVRHVLARFPALKARINEPIGPFRSPAIHAARSRAMLDVLIEAGADLDARSQWWAGGFGLLHSADPQLAEYAVSRGATVDVHAAARLGKIDHLARLLDADPSLVHARGGDGQTPLHFATSIPVAELLLERGADLDARDIDHESTPAQYMLAERQEIARFLVERGCHTDLLMAAALGHLPLARQHLDRDPTTIRLRVSEDFFPRVNPRSGGTIYQWTLGWYVSPHQVARKFDHPEMFDFLMQRSPPEVRLVNACWLRETEMVEQLLRAEPALAHRLSPGDARQLAHAARNDDLPALSLMVRAGLPLDAKSQHQGTALHWAAWHGNADMVELLLRQEPPPDVNDDDNEFRSTPLGWAIHGSENGWHRERGDYVPVVGSLLRAGARRPERAGGTAAVRAALAG